eukprot:GDKI01030921.1.p3 GENE.GDKI01030921.1~~GDKI01030921.1.p3  ORF type:complete len:157 (-),score=39.00 GDKI01030921.1:322-792(-)
MCPISAHPPLQLCSVVCVAGGLWGGVIVCACVGGEYFTTLFWAYLLPLRLAVTALAYSFDYVPHKPHDVKREHNLYRTTSKIQSLLPPTHTDAYKHSPGTWWLRVLLLGQDDHCVHHTYPQLPWYKYRHIWDKYREKFVQNGTGVAGVYRYETPWW